MNNDWDMQELVLNSREVFIVYNKTLIHFILNWGLTVKKDK